MYLSSESRAVRPFVEKSNSYKSLYFNYYSVQSRMSCEDPFRLVLGYTQAMMACFLFNPNPEKVLMIGLGGGSIVKFIYKNFPKVNIHVAEIDNRIIAFRSKFQIPNDDERLTIECCDGALLMKSNQIKKDIIFVDGFNEGGQAPALCSEEFYKDCYNRLSENGILVINLIATDKYFTAYIFRLLRIFDQQVIVVRADGCTNKIAFAFKGKNYNKAAKAIATTAKNLSLEHDINYISYANKILDSRRNRYFL